MHFFFKTDKFVSLLYFYFCALELSEAKTRLGTQVESTAAASRSVVPESESQVINLNHEIDPFLFYLLLFFFFMIA